MKDILIDLYKTKDLYSGLGQFSKNFANELTQQLPDNLRVHFLVPNNRKSDFDNSKVNIVTPNFQKRFFPVLNKGYDLWHSLHQFPAHLPPKGTQHILTIHDLNFLVEKNVLKVKKYLAKLQRNVDRATSITAISNYTKQQIEKHIDLKGKNVEVIYNGIANPTSIDSVKPGFISDKKFFFSIGII